MERSGSAQRVHPAVVSGVERTGSGQREHSTNIGGVERSGSGQRISNGGVERSGSGQRIHPDVLGRNGNALSMGTSGRNSGESVRRSFDQSREADREREWKR